MIWRPKFGQWEEIRYRKTLRATTGLHGQTGRVIVAGTGKGPINALVEIDGRHVVIPRGQLREVKE